MKNNFYTSTPQYQPAIPTNTTISLTGLGVTPTMYNASLGVQHALPNHTISAQVGTTNINPAPYQPPKHNNTVVAGIRFNF